MAVNLWECMCWLTNLNYHTIATTTSLLYDAPAYYQPIFCSNYLRYDNSGHKVKYFTNLQVWRCGEGLQEIQMCWQGFQYLVGVFPQCIFNGIALRNRIKSGGFCCLKWKYPLWGQEIINKEQLGQYFGIDPCPRSSHIMSHQTKSLKRGGYTLTRKLYLGIF